MIYHLYMRIGLLLEVWRRVNHLTLRSLSEETGISIPVLSDIERGQSAMSSRTWAKLQSWLLQEVK